METCTYKDITYVAVPATGVGKNDCDGCAGSNSAICFELASCYSNLNNLIIWVKEESNE
jgi:hypothetical protein